MRYRLRVDLQLHVDLQEAHSHDNDTSTTPQPQKVELDSVDALPTTRRSASSASDNSGLTSPLALSLSWLHLICRMYTRTEQYINYYGIAQLSVKSVLRFRCYIKDNHKDFIFNIVAGLSYLRLCLSKTPWLPFDYVFYVRPTLIEKNKLFKWKCNVANEIKNGLFVVKT